MKRLLLLAATAFFAQASQAQVNQIAGALVVDSIAQTQPDTFKVYLIVNDAPGHLSAVDSQIVGGWGMPWYIFSNKPSGTYYTKAQKMGQAIGGSGYIPTYHDSSLYWNTATAIVHTGGNSSPRHIYMRTGTVTSGPGFIGGNINMGANKGTGTNGAAVPGVLVMIRDANNKPVKFAYTDAAGNFSVSNLPLGTYSIYPELMNYTTTPFTNVTLTAANPSATGYVFGQTSNEIKPKATGISNVAAGNAVAVFPNPANGQLQISSTIADNAAVTITDITGRVVLQQNVALGSQPASIAVGQLVQGIYSVRVSGAKVQLDEKLLIQH